MTFQVLLRCDNCCMRDLCEPQINAEMLLSHDLVGQFAGFQERTLGICLEMIKPFGVFVLLVVQSWSSLQTENATFCLPPPEGSRRCILTLRSTKQSCSCI